MNYNFPYTFMYIFPSYNHWSRKDRHFIWELIWLYSPYFMHLFNHLNYLPHLDGSLVFHLVILNLIDWLWLPRAVSRGIGRHCPDPKAECHNWLAMSAVSKWRGKHRVIVAFLTNLFYMMIQSSFSTTYICFCFLAV